MSNSSLPSPSPCGSWPWVIIHTFPYTLSPCLWRGFLIPPAAAFLQGNSTEYAPCDDSFTNIETSIPATLQPWLSSTPHPSLESLKACLPLSLFLLSVCFLVIFLSACFSLYALLMCCQSVRPAFLYCTTLNQHLAYFFRITTALPFCLCLGASPLVLCGNVKTQKDTACQLPRLHINTKLGRLWQMHNDNTSQHCQREMFPQFVEKCWSFCLPPGQYGKLLPPQAYLPWHLIKSLIPSSHVLFCDYYD